MRQALLGASALLLQFVLPAVHPQHAAPVLGRADQRTVHASPQAAPRAVADDALACVFCAAAAQGRAGVLDLAPAPVALQASLDAVAPAIVRLLAAPSLTRAAPRGPPALA